MNRHSLVAIATVLLTLLPNEAGGQVGVPAPASASDALPADVAARLRALPEDELTGTRRQTAHYVKGNENNLEVFSTYISGVGGAYIGIGPDQNFTLAAKARSELVFIMDYDEVVVRLMRVEAALVANAETAEAFIAFFDEASDLEKVSQFLKEAYPQDPEMPDYLYVYKRYRKELSKHFASSRSRGLAGKQIYWLASPDDYAHIRGLVRTGRVAVLDGDLLKGKATSGIAQLLASSGIPVRVVYLSNAEEYWSRYTEEFEQSFMALGLDGKALVLRTFHDTKLPKHPTQDYYHYNVQRGGHFDTWLRRPGHVRYRDMMREVELIEKGDVSTLGFAPR